MPMAITFHAQLQFLRPVHDHSFFKPNLQNRKPAGIWASTNAFQVTHKRNRAVESTLVEPTADFEPSGKARLQELVDQLHWCAEKRLLTQARTVHGYVLKSNFDGSDSLILLNHVMHAYSKCSDFNSTKTLFEFLPRKNVFSWSVMIVAFNNQALFREGLNYFCEMMMSGDGIFPDGFAYSAVLQSCVGLGSVDSGDMVHSHIIVRGFRSHVIVSTSLLNMYAKLGKVLEAGKVFDSMAKHNDVTWNAMISGLTINGLHLEAFEYFLKMKKEGFVPDVYTLVSVLKAVGKLGDVDKGKWIHELVSEMSVEGNVIVGTALIDMYSKCGCMTEARSVFDMNFAKSKVNGPWNAMISGYALCNCTKQALQLFAKMWQNRVKANLYTYCSVFGVISKSKCSRLAKEVHAVYLKRGCDSTHLSVENAILDAYSKCGSLETVNKIFNSMKHRDVVSWTTLISGYSQSSEWDQALVMFSRMREEAFAPNDFTLASVLTACANLSYLDYGRQMHGLVCKLCLGNINYVESSLIDMYAKGGNIKEAEKVFDRISNPDVVSMTSILSAYAYHGFVSHALRHFKKMEEMDIKPSGVTLLCVLFACSHAGLVDEGLGYFRSMESEYGLVPEMEHYACVVDLLSRAGRLDEAFEFITEMPLEADEMVWQALLGGCRVHGNLELGEMAARKILSLCPEYSSTYVLLSNAYMETGGFREGGDVRKAMSEKGVRKEAAGCSWIMVRGRVHRFYARDRDHLEKELIYGMLEDLGMEMKGSGYVPDQRFALLC